MSHNDSLVDTLWEEYRVVKGLQETYRFTSLGAHDQKKFEQAAEICRANGFNPTYYVKAQANGIPADNFHAGHLACARSIENYKKLVCLESGAGADPNRFFNAQKRILSDSITLAKRKVEDILLDDVLNFTPWFRIVITKNPYPSVIKKYMKHAKAMWNTELEEFLRKHKLDVNRIKNAPDP